MKKIKIPRCKKCGGKMEIRYINAIKGFLGISIYPSGMFAGCSICGFIEKIKSLDE